MVAGEASGDQLGSRLIAALRARHPDAVFFGIGGPQMIGAGLDSWHAQEKLAVRGLVEVLAHIRELHSIRRALGARLITERPDVFVGIDAPDFNLPLERRLRDAGIRTAHYVSPTIWAWRPGRIKTIRRAVDHMLVLFPFEEGLYREAGVAVTCVGHPLADEFPDAVDRTSLRVQLRLRPDATVITLLPGSRQDELERMATPFIRAAKIIHALRPRIQFLAPFATRETLDRFEQSLHDCDATGLPIQRLFGHAHEAMAAADVILAASGTATLEATLAKRPMVIAYKLSPLTYRIARRLARVPYIGLPNILAREFIVPELLQDDATPENLAQALLNLLDDAIVRAALAERFAAIHRTLKRNTAQRAAEALLSLVDMKETAHAQALSV